MGISYVGARMSNHFGTCAYYAQMALEHDMVGFAATRGRHEHHGPHRRHYSPAG